MSENGRVALPDVWEWSGGHLGCPKMVGWPFLDAREWSGGLPKCPGAFGRPHGYQEVVERPSQMSGSGRDALPDVRSCRESLTDVREVSGGPHGCPGVVGRPSRMSGSCWEALTDVR